MKILASKIDQSVNFIEQHLVGFIESRYVRRVDNYFIGYLSSQTGCNRGCTFCHLTATGQSQFNDVTIAEYMNQARRILEHYEQDVTAKVVHWNLMARGEPLANKHVLHRGTDLLTQLGNLSLDYDLRPKFNISTIMPVTLKDRLVDVFPLVTPTIYYSMYSARDAWRKKWLPAAMPVADAIDQLKEYQQITKKITKIHGAFIAGENDSKHDVDELIAALENLHVEFNIVRYNPLTPDQGAESERLEEILFRLQQFMPTKIITRVGADIYASCGQFLY